jgi:hypothetical protein
VRRTTTWTIALVTSLAVSGATGTAVAAAATSPQPQTQTQDRSAFVAADGHTYDYASGTTSDPRAADQVAKIRTLLPADWRSRQAAALARFGVEPSAAQDALGRAIDPTRYQCAPTRLDAFVDGVVADIDPSSLFVLSMLGGFDFPTYDALLFGSTDDPAYALTKDSRNELTSSFRAEVLGHRRHRHSAHGHAR